MPHESCVEDVGILLRLSVSPHVRLFVFERRRAPAHRLSAGGVPVGTHTN